MSIIFVIDDDENSSHIPYSLFPGLIPPGAPATMILEDDANDVYVEKQWIYIEDELDSSDCG